MASSDEVRNALAERVATPPVPANGEEEGGGSIRAVIDRQAAELGLVLPAGMDPDRFARLIVTAVKATPKLLLAMGTIQGRQSVLLAAMEAATVGLEPNTPMQQAWLVPRRATGPDGEKVWEARLWLGYRGLLTLVRRSNTVRELVADVVFEGDGFGWSRELDRDTLWHRPTPGTRGKATMVYAIARLHGGGTQFAVLSREDVEARRAYSDGWNDAKSRPYSPWTKWPDAMWRKSALRALVPWLDLTVEATTQVSGALAADGARLVLSPERTTIEATHDHDHGDDDAGDGGDAGDEPAPGAVAIGDAAPGPEPDGSA